MSLGNGGGDLLSAAIGFGGAVVGGAFTLAGVMMQQRGEEKRRKVQDAEALRAFLKALGTEMDTVWATYMVNVGSVIEAVPADEYWDQVWESTTEYFAVYRSGAGQLGHIKADELRMSIVAAYTTAMGLLESFRTYSDLVRSAWALELDAESQRSIAPDQWHVVEQAWPKLKAHHDLTKRLVAEMQEEISRNLYLVG